MKTILTIFTLCKAEASSLKKKKFLFYSFVRLHDDGRTRRPKHVVAKYNEYKILIVLCYSDPIIDMEKAKLELLETGS